MKTLILTITLAFSFAAKGETVNFSNNWNGVSTSFSSANGTYSLRYYPTLLSTTALPVFTSGQSNLGTYVGTPAVGDSINSTNLGGFYNGPGDVDVAVQQPVAYVIRWTAVNAGIVSLFGYYMDNYGFGNGDTSGLSASYISRIVDNDTSTNMYINGASLLSGQNGGFQSAPGTYAFTPGDYVEMVVWGNNDGSTPNTAQLNFGFIYTVIPESSYLLIISLVIVLGLRRKV